MKKLVASLIMLLVLYGCPHSSPTPDPETITGVLPMAVAPSHIIGDVSPFLTGAGHWPNGRTGISMYKYYGVQVDSSNTWAHKIDPQIIVDFGKAHNAKKIGCEFSNFYIDVDVWKHVSRQLDPVITRGGYVNSIHLDGPFRRLLSGIHSNGHDLDYVTDYMVDFWAGMKARYPRTDVGLIVNLPNWDLTPELPGVNRHNTVFSGHTYLHVLNVFYNKLNTAGRKLAFLELDCPFNYFVRANNVAKFRLLKKWCRDRGVKLHVVINTVPSSNAQFLSGSIKYVKTLKINNIEPDLYIVQSWYKKPTANFPETELGTMSNVLFMVGLELQK